MFWILIQIRDQKSGYFSLDCLNVESLHSCSCTDHFSVRTIICTSLLCSKFIVATSCYQTYSYDLYFLCRRPNNIHCFKWNVKKHVKGHKQAVTWCDITHLIWNVFQENVSWNFSHQLRQSATLIFCGHFEDLLLSACDHLSLLLVFTEASLTQAWCTSLTSQLSLPWRQVLSCK